MDLKLMVGSRVVRGPDWKRGNEDDEEGHIGTVVKIGWAGSHKYPDKAVVVQWDSGNRLNYRAGCDGTFDLLLIDNAAAGVRHTNVKCGACKQTSIAGIRWKCSTCKELNLCSPCYNAGNHSKLHEFLRMTTPNSKGIKVSRRQGSVTMEAKGIFQGAKVERGPTWEWGDQDGGKGQLGLVLEIMGWSSETERSAAKVSWSSGSSSVYRLGVGGKVDLKCKTPASGGCYYKDHLPVLGELAEQINPHTSIPIGFGKVSKGNVMSAGTTSLLVACYQGSLDIVMLSLEACADLKLKDEVGNTALHFSATGNQPQILKLLLQNKSNINSVNNEGQSALHKAVEEKHVDCVKVLLDNNCDVNIQDRLGNTALHNAIGKENKEIVTLLTTHPMVDFTLKNCQGYNAMHHAAQEGNSHAIEQIIARCNMLVDLKKDDGYAALHLAALNGNLLATQMLVEKGNATLEIRTYCQSTPLMCAVVKGHLHVAEYLVEKGSAVNTTDKDGASALHLSLLTHNTIKLYHSSPQLNTKGKADALWEQNNQGVLDMAKLLLKAGADVTIKDTDGNTALHYSAIENQPRMMKLLLQNKSNINSVNNEGQSALHIATSKQHLDCVKVLIDNNCDVNIQDSYDNTAHHIAISEENKEIVTLLTKHPKVDLTLKNFLGLNALHHAAMQGNSHATEQILARFAELVDVKDNDGFLALHLAALNGHLTATQALIEKGSAAIEPLDGHQQTPLMLAVTRGHLHVVKYLVEKGSSVNTSDENQDSALHLALLIQNTIEKDQGSTQLTDKGTIELVQYLLEQGADTRLKDNEGRTPLDLASDAELQSLINQYTIEEPNCIVCEDQKACVIFKPCDHKTTCSECCNKMKKCLTCHVVIDRKIHADGTDLTSTKVENKVDKTELENLRRELEESKVCGICFDQPRNVAFLCGHSTCNKCAASLKICHMCRQPITRRIKLF